MSDTAHPEATASPSPGAAAKLGAELRTRRESLGWRLPDLANSLRIRQAYLEAIEAGRIGDLPGSTYALGFVRAYASALGLPGEQVASRFRAQSAGAAERPALTFPAPVPQRGVPAGALMLLGLLILAGAYSGWYYVSEHQRTPPETVPPIPDRLMPHRAEKPAPSPQVASILPTASAPTQPAPAPPGALPGALPGAPSPTLSGASPAPAPQVTAAPPPASVTAPAGTVPSGPSPAVVTAPAALPAVPPPAAAPPPAPAANRIVIKAAGLAWVTVKPKAGGPAVFNKLMHAGDSWTMPSNPPGVLLLTTGNAGGTQLTVDDTPVVKLGPDGTVFRDLPLDAEMLKSGHLPPSRPPHPKPVVVHQAAAEDDTAPQPAAGATHPAPPSATPSPAPAPPR